MSRVIGTIDQHALGVVADRRHEQRRVLEVGVLLHLRHVLVRELHAVEAERLDAGLLVDGDQLLAAAGVARDAEHGGRRDRRARCRHRPAAAGWRWRPSDSSPDWRCGWRPAASGDGPWPARGSRRSSRRPRDGPCWRRSPRCRHCRALPPAPWPRHRAGRARRCRLHLAISARLPRSLRSAIGSSSSSMSGRSFSRSRICRPVVPCWPSMKILVLLLVVMVFSLANSGPLGRGRLEKKEGDGSRLILSSGFTIRRVCYARASSHRLRRAAASRPEEGERRHDGAHISSRAPDVKV